MIGIDNCHTHILSVKDAFALVVIPKHCIRLDVTDNNFHIFDLHFSKLTLLCDIIQFQEGQDVRIATADIWQMSSNVTLHIT